MQWTGSWRSRKKRPEIVPSFSVIEGGSAAGSSRASYDRDDWGSADMPASPSRPRSTVQQGTPTPASAPIARSKIGAAWGEANLEHSGAPARRRDDVDDMAREWVNARLEATEERMNARLAGIDGRLDAGLAKLDGDIRSLSANIQVLTNTATLLLEDTRSVKEDVKNIKEQRFGFILWIIGTFLAVFLSVLAMITFGKDMFEWGQQLPMTEAAPPASVPPAK